MMDLDQLVDSLDDLRREDLEAWMRNALVAADEASGKTVFSDMECARLQLICTLHYDMDVEVETLPVIMDLIDQLHEARHRLNTLSHAIMRQDEDIRSRILAGLQDK